MKTHADCLAEALDRISSSTHKPEALSFWYGHAAYFAVLLGDAVAAEDFRAKQVLCWPDFCSPEAVNAALVA
jgi:hypothetical protein